MHFHNISIVNPTIYSLQMHAYDKSSCGEKKNRANVTSYVWDPRESTVRGGDSMLDGSVCNILKISEANKAKTQLNARGQTVDYGFSILLFLCVLKVVYDWKVWIADTDKNLTQSKWQN